MRRCGGLNMRKTRKNSDLEEVIRVEADKLHQYLQKEKIDANEAIQLLRSAEKNKPKKATSLKIGKKSFKYMYLSDTHIGHKEFKDELFDLFVDEYKRFKPDFVLHPGDHLEGMSGRPGQIYELSEVGFENQIAKCSDLYNKLDKCPIYGIDGNHDEWYAKKHNGGVIVGEELQARVKNYNNLGQMEGDIDVNGILIRMFHANDGTAYAASYKIQKLIESFTGGDKPHIVHSGHYHKHLTLFTRNVYGIESGTMCGQSEFMRGKKLPAHMGFGAITVHPNEGWGIGKLNHTWYPYYQPERKPKKLKLK